VPAAVTYPDNGQRLWISHDQGRTPGDFFLGDGVDAEHPGPLVIFAHGNGDLIEDYTGGLRGYTRRGISVLMVEYRGCGSADGKPSKKNITEDFLAFYDLMVTRPEVDPDAIIFHGRSMGGGMVAALALERRPAALVLESTYTSIMDFAQRMLVPSFLIKDKWDVITTLRQYDGPVVISHAETDPIIPYAMAEINRAAAPGHHFNLSTLGHNEPMPDTFFGDVVDFLQQRGVVVP
jgi:hypothetical protein